MHYSEWIPVTVKTLRKANNMTIHHLSLLCDLSVSYISDIERGRTIPTIETLDKLLTALGTTLVLDVEKDYIIPNHVLINRETLTRLSSIIKELSPKDETP